ncbi:hypothetical protein [Bordetella genomosp. 4]|uniref:Uncharacterized protein n=1 Tax=Bordetella genomosp. 4 TaxID=463044 RepID=A0A261U5G7_9BORD|nr:hypothetical protein [Bordetella genomosp. 4]OZI56727.1 hypothetical protein CAL20_15105 [Bordetella genomosp. 4]
MSFTKNWVNQQENKEELQDLMKALVEEGGLQRASEGIAKKLASTGDFQELSTDQKSVFDKYIQPNLVINCANPDCENEIEMHLVADAIRYGRDDALCAHCNYVINDMPDNM